MSPPSRPLEECFWEKVDRQGPNECWFWTGSSTKREGGYGQIAKKAPARGMFYAHRVSYELDHGSIIANLEVQHSCNTPLCVNPAHLSQGTPLVNAQYRNEQGRQAKGEDFPQAKLTEKKVAEIRCEYVRGSRTYGQIALALKYHVSRSAIGRVVRGESWK